MPDPLFFLLLLVCAGIPIGIGLLLYFVPRRAGHPRAARYLTVGYSALVALLVLLVGFEDRLFTKTEASALIQQHGIELTDEFELLNNKSMSGIGDYYHTFSLEISEPDKHRVISQIKRSKDFHADSSSRASLLRGPNRYAGPERVRNYETKDAFVRESFKPSGKPGYAPTFHRISISKARHQLQFEDIDE